MPSAPQTWVTAQAIQARIQAELLVTDSLVSNASPFTPFSAGDAATYGATNAIYIGVPKNLNAAYIRQCHIIPNVHENVYRRNMTGMSGGTTFDEAAYYIHFLYRYDAAWYQAEQDIIAARDVFYPVMIRHATMPGAPVIEAARPDFTATNGIAVGQHIIPDVGFDWLCWGFVWWARQVYSIPGGIVA